MSRSHLPCDTCGSSDAMTEYENGNYCFSCQSKTWLQKLDAGEFGEYFPTLMDVPEENGPLQFPYTMCQEFSRKARKILLRAGITAAMCRKYQIGFVSYERIRLPGTGSMITLEDRIILPYSSGPDLIYYQARETRGETPKYYTIGQKRPWTHTMWYGSPQEVILVEDIFSAIRLDNLGFPVTALLGTSVSEDYLQTLAGYDKVIIWFDDDEPGKKGATKLYNKLRLYVKSCSVIRNTKEPKLCFDSEIQKVLTCAWQEDTK